MSPIVEVVEAANLDPTPMEEFGLVDETRRGERLSTQNEGGHGVRIAELDEVVVVDARHHLDQRESLLDRSVFDVVGEQGRLVVVDDRHHTMGAAGAAESDRVCRTDQHQPHPDQQRRQQDHEPRKGRRIEDLRGRLAPEHRQ
jgi:hypothetical protein